MLQFTDDQVRAKAVELGLIGEADELPRQLRSRIVAALTQDLPPQEPAADVPIANSIVVQPGGGIDINGRPFPWVVQADRIEVSLQPDGSGMVRLTIPARNVQITRPPDESE